MGNSLQDYRSKIGLFSYSSKPCKIRTCQKKHKQKTNFLNKSKMKVSAILLFCLLTVWTSTSIRVNNIEAHKVHVNHQYPALVCTTFHKYTGQSHQIPDGAHSQYSELLHQELDSAHLHQHRGTGGY